MWVMNVLNMMGVTRIFIYPTLTEVTNSTVCVRNNMAERRGDILDEKPTISELCEHIHIGSK